MHTAVYSTVKNSPDTKKIEEIARIRKRLFVDKMGWKLNHHNGMELDQYDRPETIYIAVEKRGRIVGSTRLLQTTSVKDGWSYMIRDAGLGKIPEIPDNLMFHPPVDLGIWEASRFTVDPDLASRDRNTILAEVCHGAVNFLNSVDAKHILGLMSPFFLRWLPRQGFDVEKAGPTLQSTGDPIGVIQYNLKAAKIQVSSAGQRF